MRSSGNPLSRDEWRKMISSPEVQYDQDLTKQKLVSIDSIHFFAENDSAAVTTMTVDLYFSYKDTPNEDRAKITLIWERCGTTDADAESDWKIMHFQRATGQPIPKE